MVTYLFRRFTLLEGYDGDLLIAPLLVARVSDHNMAKFLRSNQRCTAGVLDIEEIASRLEASNLSVPESLSFLELTGILEKSHESTIAPFKQLILISDFDEGLDALVEGVENDGGAISQTLAVGSVPDDQSGKHNLVAILLKEYSPDIVRDIYRRFVEEEGVGFLQGYFYQREFRVDGVFMPGAGTPCHFCHYDRLAAREIRSFHHSPHSWHELIRLIDTSKQTIPPALPLCGTDIHFAAHIFRRRIQQLLGVPDTREHLDSFFTSLRADLISCTTDSEPIPHWHACDCLKKVF